MPKKQTRKPINTQTGSPPSGLMGWLCKSLQTALTILDSIDIIEAFESVEQFFESDHTQAPDCILLDIRLPGQSGLDALPAIKEQFPDTEVLLLTQDDDYRSVLTAIQYGAAGYIIKGDSAKTIHQAIIDVHNGASVIDPKLSRIVLNHLVHDKHSEGSTPLSPRETQVLRLRADGLTKKEVANQLNISHHAVDLYTRNIYTKLQSPNIAAAIASAIRRGMI